MLRWFTEGLHTAHDVSTCTGESAGSVVEMGPEQSNSGDGGLRFSTSEPCRTLVGVTLGRVPHRRGQWPQKGIEPNCDLAQLNPYTVTVSQVGTLVFENRA